MIGFGMLVLMVATTITFALDECNKLVRSDQKGESVACFELLDNSVEKIFCNQFENEECNGNQGVYPVPVDGIAHPKKNATLVLIATI